MKGELPLYQGAMPQAPQQQFAQVPQLPRMQMYGEQLDSALAAGLDAVDKYADLHDFGVRQEAEHRMRQNELEMQREFERKSALAPGAEGSFFSAEGHLNEDAVAAFTDKWQQLNREVARPYWKRENAMRGEEQVLALNDQLAGNVGLGLLKMESRHRQQVFKDNYDLAVAQGDTAGACRIVDDAVASGQITSARGQAMKLNARRGAVEDTIYGLTENDPEAAFDYLYGGNGGILTPQRRLQLAESLRSKLKQREAARLDDFFSPMPASVQAEMKEEGKAKGAKDGNAPEFWGTHSQQEIVWLHAVKNGAAAEVLPAVRGHAMTEAMSLHPGLLDDAAAAEKARAEFEARYEYFGLEKAAISRIWNEGMKNLKRVRAGGINPKERLNAARGGGQLFNVRVWDEWQRSWRRDEDGDMTLEEFAKGGYARLRWGAAAGVTDKDDNRKAYAKIAKLKQVNMQSEVEGRIQERYAAWCETKEGEEATPLLQLEKLNAIASEEAGHKVSVGSANDIHDTWDAALKQQTKLYESFQESNPRNKKEARPEATAPWQKVDIGFDTERKDLPRGILVPEAMLQGKKAEDVVYDMVFDNEHFLRLPVVGTTKGNAPVMTYATAREAGRMPDRVYTVKGKLRSGDSSVLLDEVENPVGNVKYGRGNYATGDWAGTLNTQQVPQALQPFIGDFVEAGQQYGVNPALLVAISMHETGDGTSSAFRNKKNAMGISDAKGVLQMPSVRSGIFRMAKVLGGKAHYKGRSLREIAKVYAPVGAQNDPRGLNGGWLGGVAAKLKMINK